MQSIDQANANNTVGIVLDLGFIAEAGAENAVFEIERGHIGATTLRITGTDPSGRPFDYSYVRHGLQ